jgi:hypothetical protein
MHFLQIIFAALVEDVLYETQDEFASLLKSLIKA